MVSPLFERRLAVPCTGLKIAGRSATEAELKAVPSIGDAYAKKIIAGRPFSNKSQLLSKKIVPKPVYDKIKDMIIAKKS
ncbi:MAG: helix-hairpin-helix domain-containing protein [Desulfuromonadaceae bacterium]